jgi:flagellar M-ring protein FliF
VANAPFDGVDKPFEPPVVLDWWRDPANLPLAKEIGKYLLLFAVLAFLYYRILLPLMRPAIKKFDEVTALPPEPEPEEKDEISEEVAAELAEEELEEQEVERRNQGYRKNLEMAQELARQDPRIVANVVKAWLGSNE